MEVRTMRENSFLEYTMHPIAEVHGLHNYSSELGSRPRVLVVDDNPTILKIETLFLQSLGCEVKAVISGEEALQHSINKFDMVFLDIDLPDMSGIDVVEVMRIQENDFHVPVIAITARDVTYKNECLAAGFDDFLQKPATVQVLQKLLEKYLGFFEGRFKAEHRMITEGLGKS